MNYKKSMFSGFVVILFTAFILMGCEQKKETPENQTQQPTTTTTPTQQTPAAVDTTKQKPPEAQLTGEWEGKFGDRKMTLKIDSLNGNNFQGSTVVRWDSPKKEKITGEFNPDTREMKIKETAGTRNNGNYSGTVSADLKTFKGVWQDNGNRRTYNITLNKK